MNNSLAVKYYCTVMPACELNEARNLVLSPCFSCFAEAIEICFIVLCLVGGRSVE